MPKNTCGYIPLPMPKTSKKKWCMYIPLGNVLEMILFDGNTCFTPDFPDIPIESIDLDDNRYLTQEALNKICKKLMQKMEVVYNSDLDIWEALPLDDNDWLPF